MIHASIVKTEKDNYLVMHSHLSDAGEIWNIKKMPGRYWLDEENAWIIPIRPGVASAYRDVFKNETVAALLEEYEQEYRDKMKRPAPGTVNPWKVPAAAAVEIACKDHLETVHHGSRTDYIRIHAPYNFWS